MTLIKRSGFGNVQRFRGGLVFKAHRLFVSLNSRLESNRKREGLGFRGSGVGVQGSGLGVQGSGFRVQGSGCRGPGRADPGRPDPEPDPVAEPVGGCD